MLLNAAAILAASDRNTVIVDVPEWGDPGTPQSDPASPDVAQVLVGTMGALAAARLQDWLLGQPQAASPATEAGEPDDSDEVVTCDSPGGEPEPVGQAGPPEPDGDEEPERRYTRTQQTELMLRYVAESILDPDTRRPAFTAEQIEALGTRSKVPLLRIYHAALELNGDTKASSEELEKNSGGTTAGGSGGG